ncbi:hypothetical protein DFH07DRAFT_956953 [Mycena maculata]|uniref:Uncharacterized protein n=1 Tax=Mycena maculata TaxID=230809 RepID=A0AAD7JG93_9AGAR|nr:hypothetical protein DFH07DRAFT_956953 [Mycena maculata]
MHGSALRFVNALHAAAPLRVHALLPSPSSRHTLPLPLCRHWPPPPRLTAPDAENSSFQMPLSRSSPPRPSPLPLDQYRALPPRHAFSKAIYSPPLSLPPATLYAFYVALSTFSHALEDLTHSTLLKYLLCSL